MDGMNFVGIDVETANSSRGSICSIGLAVVENGKIVRVENWLTRPPHELDWFDGFNIGIHGITPSAVADQPCFAERLDQALKIIDGRPVIAHNAAFDIGALRGACLADDLPWPTLTYGCTLVLSRRLLDLLSYRLPIVCDALGIEFRHHHAAGADASAAAEILLELARRQGTDDLTSLAASAQVRLGQVGGDAWSGCVRTWDGAPPSANDDADPTHPLFGQNIVFTGALSIVRSDAWHAAAHFGATPDKGVTKKTTMLVVGDGFTGNSPSEFHTGKAARAAALQAKGQRIEVLSEGDFIEMLTDAETSGTRRG
jgi:DNA polymerase III subunit epsilon